MRTLPMSALLLGCLACPLVAEPNAEPNLAWGWGLEAEATLTQPMLVDEKGVVSFPSHLALESVTLGFSASWEFRTLWHPMWLGVRGSAWLVGLDGLVFPFPRINLTTRWDITEWLSFGLEAPYNPGVSLLVAKHWYLFYGATDWLAEDDVAMRSVAVLYVNEY